MKIAFFSGKTHDKREFSKAMLDYQKVINKRDM